MRWGVWCRAVRRHAPSRTRWSASLLRRFKRVADPMHGPDRAGPQLVAQGLDMRVDGASTGGVDPVPDLFEQLLARQHGLRFARQGREQVEFGRGQMHGFVVERHTACGRVDYNRAEIEDFRVLAVLGDHLGAFHTAQQRLAARQQLTHRKRLGHVIVRTGAQADDDIGLLVTRGEHEHRHRTVRHDTLGGLDAVDAREHHIHDDEVGVHLRRVNQKIIHRILLSLQKRSLWNSQPPNQVNQ